MLLLASASTQPKTPSNPIVGILLLIVLALISAEMVRHKKRLPSFLNVLSYTYTEFLILGLLMGPHVFNLIDQTILKAADPFLHLSLGGVGLIYGLQFEFGRMKRFRPQMYGLAFFQSVVTFLVCLAGLFPLTVLLGMEVAGAAFFSAILATIASVSAPQVIAHAIQEQQLRGDNAHLLQFITAFDGFFGVVILTLLLGIRSEFGLTQWPALNCVIGLILSANVGLACGLVFHWLTERRASIQEMVLYLLGLVTLGSSVAATLHLSPLFVNIVFGLTVANLSVRVDEIFRQMGRLERPLFIMMLILVGARWEFSGQWLLALAVAYFVFRLLGKWLGCYTGIRLFPQYFQPVDRLGIALVGQGGMALALLINFSLVQAIDQRPILETVVIVSIMITELIAPLMVRSALGRAGERRPAK